MTRREEIVAKYRLSTSNYDPDPNCKFCKGSGERVLKSGDETFCICLFVAHECVPQIADGLASFAKRELTRLSPPTPERPNE